MHIIKHAHLAQHTALVWIFIYLFFHFFFCKIYFICIFRFDVNSNHNRTTFIIFFLVRIKRTKRPSDATNKLLPNALVISFSKAHVNPVPENTPNHLACQSNWGLQHFINRSVFAAKVIWTECVQLKWYELNVWYCSYFILTCQTAFLWCF